MKTYEQFIAEAVVATKKKPSARRSLPSPEERGEFRDKFKTITTSDAYYNARNKKGTHSWHLTGHNPDAKYGSSHDIESMKEKVFGKRRKGTSHLFWIHSKHGIVTHPAVGDVTHRDVQDHLGHGQRKGIKVDKKVQKKVKEGGIGAVTGQGRIEHHEGGGGMISYTHRGSSPKTAAVRTIARAYPKYKIHDGLGNLLESDMKKKWGELLASPAWKKAPENMSQWQLTGHNPGTKRGTTHEIEATKERIFGKRKGNTELMWLHSNHGIVTHPAVGDTSHSDIDGPAWNPKHKKRKGINVDKNIQKQVNDGGVGSHWGLGRIEHHEGGGGIISYHHKGGIPKSSAVRMISRAYPKYQIHDGHGNLLEGFTTGKDGWLHSRSTGRRRWLKGNHSIERQGKRGWTVYDWHASKELHVAKTARDAKAWSEKNRSSTSSHAPVNIKMWENWSYAHDFDNMPNSEKQKYVYHVTTAARAAKIVKHGLKPRSPKGRTNYPSQKEHTQGHAFVTNHQGVRYWKDQTLHAVYRRKREVDEGDAENIHVVKFPIANMKKSTRRKLRMDNLGTKDARRHDDEPLIEPSTHEGSTAFKIKKKVR